MTDLLEATDVIYKDWIAFAPSDPFVFENEDSPDATTALFEGDSPWYRVSVREAAGGRANLNSVAGTRKYERVGFLSIQCFDLQNKGIKNVLSLAEAARDYFEDRRLNSTVIYLNGTIRIQPPDGKWKPVLIEIAVEYTDQK